MSSPFVYGKVVESQHFVGREKELSQLSSNLVYQKNTLMLALRGQGKSTLLKKAATAARSRDYQLRICMLSLAKVSTMERFCSEYAKAVIKATSKNLEEAVSSVRRYLKDTCPVMAAEATDIDGFTLAFESHDTKEIIGSVIELPELIAKDKNLKVVVCIDDFHRFFDIAEASSFLEILDQCWCDHKNASYCICADRTEQIERIRKSFRLFKEASQVIELENIPPSVFVDYIRNTFADTGKYIDDGAASLLVDLVGGHPHYVQQLAQLSWLRTSVVCPGDVVREAHQSMVDQMALVFKTLTESFTSQQLCYLRAVLCGETVISSTEVLHRYGISSATSASRSKAALIDRNIITVFKGKVLFLDPVYACWLKTKYFK